jgi:3-deoxy-7-phosphoheptulonate synthase
MIEVHNDPQRALCDGAQSIKPEDFLVLVKKIEVMLPLLGKELC